MSKDAKKKPWCKQSSPPEWWRGEPDNQRLLQAAPPEKYLLLLAKIRFVVLKVLHPLGTGSSGRWSPCPPLQWCARLARGRPQRSRWSCQMPGVSMNHATVFYRNPGFTNKSLTCIPIFEMADLVIPLASMGTTIRDLFWWGFPSLVLARRQAQSDW